MRLEDEPSLQRFDGSPGDEIPRHFHSLHSCRNGANAHVSAKRPRCRRKAADREVEEHGRWQKKRENLSMPATCRQWSINDRIAIALNCMQTKQSNHDLQVGTVLHVACACWPFFILRLP